jgi:hydrogenase/urease accessory protein HupE
MKLRLRWVAGLLCVAWATGSSAHEIRPAYLQINEVAPDAYDVLWQVPSRGDMVLDIEPRFDPQFGIDEAGQAALLDGFVVYRFRLTGDAGLPGTELAIRGLEQTTVDVLASLKLLDGHEYTLLLQPRTPLVTIPQAPSAWTVITTYTTLGIEHILLGIDHLLFVAALMLIVLDWRMLLKTITAFTVAHSITLALATLGLFTLPPPPVEALIALSIVLVCVEAVRLRRGETSLALRWPWVIAFGFGLLHGFGFAGALAEIGMPQGDIPLALLFFNIGVELGQLLFIAAILAAAALWRRLFRFPQPAPVAAAYLIGTIACFWFLERMNQMIGTPISI